MSAATLITSSDLDNLAVIIASWGQILEHDPDDLSLDIYQAVVAVSQTATAVEKEVLLGSHAT